MVNDHQFNWFLWAATGAAVEIPPGKIPVVSVQ
jgi:hypothetical protein